MSSRVRSRNGFETGLDGAIGSGDTSFNVDSASGLTAPMYLCIDPESPTLREYILVGSFGATSMASVTRGLDGSAGGAQAHATGAPVRAVPVHQWLDLLFDDIEDIEADISAHVGGTDTSDHPEATVSVRGFMSAADKTKLDGVATGAVADHGALAGLTDDDHLDYLTAARHAAVDAADHSAGASTDGQVLTSDGAGGAAWEDIIQDHGGLTGLTDDDHALYHTDARAVTWHDADDHSGLSASQIVTGVLPFAQLPTGTGAADVAVGNHLHAATYLALAGGTMTGALIAADGSAAAPGLTFDGDGNSGFYVTGNNGRVDWSGNGTNGGHLNALGVRVVDGSVSSPSLGFRDDVDTGFYRDSSTLRWTVNSVFGGYLWNNGVRVDDGSNPATPGFSWANDQDLGMYRPAANTLGFAAAGVNVARMIDGGSTSSFFIQDGLTDVGNVETLRANRGVGGAMVPIGYFSSWKKDPVTGKPAKTLIVPLLESPRFPGLGIIDKIAMSDFERSSTKQREWGVVLDDVKAVDDNLRYLTTKGDSWGHGPDEMAFVAVLWEGLKDARGRIAVLEAAA
jgi:hypothetical protein